MEYARARATYRAFLVSRRKSVAHSLNCDSARRKYNPPTNDRREPWALTAQFNAMMKSGSAERAPLLQRDKTHRRRRCRPTTRPTPSTQCCLRNYGNYGNLTHCLTCAQASQVLILLVGPEMVHGRLLLCFYCDPIQKGAIWAEQRGDLPQARHHADAAELGLLADLLAKHGLALPCDMLPHAHVLSRRPLLSSRCSRWHRVPRPRRVDGATCYAIDAMPHAATASSSRRRVSTRRCRQKLLSPIRCSDEARAIPPSPLATPLRRPARLTYSYTYPPASAASAARSFAWSRSGQ